jgi:hypothetical protein
MAQAHRSLLALVDEATVELGRFDVALAPQVTRFAESLDQMRGELDRLDTAGQEGARQAEATASDIAEKNRTLAANLREMSEAQASIDQALETRIASMQRLYDDAQQKQGDIESRLDGLTSAISGALSRAENKAREVGAFLSETSAATAGALVSQYDDLRQAAARERESAAASLTAAYEQNLAEMNQLFQQATERYKAVSQELRGMTAEIQRELETTRQELRRGAIDLPRETSEQAAALRRVVAEQIKALNELTDIVARSGRMYDVAEPAAPRAEHAAPALREARAESLPAVRRDARFEPRPTATRPSAPAPTSATTAAPAPVAPAASERSGGWMTNLLARASAEEAPPRPAPTSDPLDNLSADIARVVDENALIDAWERYRRGEHNAFSRRLYTPQGARTFEEVRRRYHAEPDFRVTVDRYIREFERLLTEIDREDRDGQLTRSYLASDTGKVYALLAHASGRLE